MANPAPRSQSTPVTGPTVRGDLAAPLLRVRGLAVSFARAGEAPVRAVDGVSLTVYPRQTLAIVGESGCGKSVTALSILRLVACPPGKLEGGRVLFRPTAAGGEDVDLLELPEAGMREVRGNQIAMIFQEPMTSLNPVFSVGEQVVEAIRLHQPVARRDAQEACARAMVEVGIADDTDGAARRMREYPHQFSGGMRQRVMIAMALACRPRLLLADEPTTALDVTTQAQILDLLGAVKDTRGMGMVLITHDLGLVAQHADVACVMYAGRVVEYATVPVLFAKPLHPYTRGLLACRARLGDRRERLVTVREVIDRPGEFDRIPGRRPWWPHHRATAGTQGPPDSGPDVAALHEVEPGHWVGVWRTAGSFDDKGSEPDVEFRRRAGSGAASRQ